MSGSPRSDRGFHLLDVAALVVGYSLASLLVRAFWPVGEVVTVPVFLVLATDFAWLGLAMSGPVVLLGHRRRDGEEGEMEATGSGTRTWAELAWLIIGFYWIAMTILVVPGRISEDRILDTAFLGLFPIIAALGLRLVRLRLPGSRGGLDAWTHRVAIGLLVTWPLAWVGLILLGKALR